MFSDTTAALKADAGALFEAHTSSRLCNEDSACLGYNAQRTPSKIIFKVKVLVQKKDV